MDDLIVVVLGLLAGFIVYKTLTFIFDMIRGSLYLKHIRKTLKITFDQIENNNKEFKVLREEINESYKEKINVINMAKEDEISQIDLETNQKLKELDDAITRN